MKIQVFVRSPDWLNSAGTRIRYRRLQPEFARFGCTLAIDSLSSIRECLKLNADVYLFSKCQDSGALMLADMLREAGALVGFDLFDDYVSSQSSSTFAQRNFQRDMSENVDFMLCSTKRMSDVAKLIAPAVPTHVLNDPFEAVAREKLVQRLRCKQDPMRQNRRIDVLWFGNGNNPLFPVGVSDLVAFGDALAPLRAAGLDVRIKVLTNADALETDGLHLLRRLPYPTEVENWSIDAEEASLNKATLVFLPVSYQSFSIAKSLNRAVTALTHGTQILTAGYPLYAPLSSFVYNCATELARDLEASSLKLRSSTLDQLETLLSSLADPSQEVIRFLEFVAELPKDVAKISVGQRPLRAILHGSSSTPAIHNMGRALGWLSLASPLTRHSLGFSAQIGFFDGSKTPELRLMSETLPRVRGKWYDLAQALPKKEYGAYSHTLPIPESASGKFLRSLSPSMLKTRAGRIIHSEQIMSATEEAFGTIFGDMVMMRSEMEMPLPGMAKLEAALG